MTTNPSRRIPELDGIRGVAILLVLLWHFFVLPIVAPPGTLLSYLQAAGRLTWSGVDLFFVLSGFLIGGILMDARDAENYFSVFYRRRFFRIVPLYFLVVAGSWALCHWAGEGRFAFMTGDRLPWPPYFLFLQNFWMATRTTLGGVWGLGGTWSLAIEEQFYLTLPLLIRTLSPRRLAAVLVGGVVAAPALRILFYALWPHHYLSWFVIMPCRADALLLGALGAMAVRDPTWRERLQRNRLAMAGALGVLLAGLYFLTKMVRWPTDVTLLAGGYTWLALFYVSVLLYAVVHSQSWLAGCLRLRWLKWLGAIAYGTYLLHQQVRGTLFGLLWGRDPLNLSLPVFVVSVLALAITLAVCQASWKYFERPLLRIGHRRNYR
jgi:peptidoglycan/LPS O-acetylase OafA/YrhL